MNIYHSSQIFDELNAPFCTFFTVLCSNWRDYGKKYRSFSVGKWYECREYHPLFPGKRFGTCGSVLERAKGLGVPCVWFAKSDWESGELVLSTLREHDIDFVVLAGFLARVPDNILHAYPNKMINIHPSLLPKFGGKGMYGDRVHEAVIASGEKESGITIHYTNEHYDEGGIICQQKCPVLPGDTPEELAQRIHRLEYEYYPKVIEELVEGLSPSYL